MRTLKLTEEEFETVNWCLNQMRKEGLDQVCLKCESRGAQVLERDDELRIVLCTACPRSDEHH